ncbi:glycosyl hydrolase family 95 catalytic domain-containing protein [Alkalibacterium olivapovliticus]|uniref:Glycosyl hydrolase family 65 n=1 Tax=Alkalibacterium olivapovliticus TaxID=99907 RepID=A0A2T0W5N8_9LACT|nr:glycoside hydrolase N-terminal domain-containing protein [Alkalibacterium olivapovliticus]PRY81358.1 glycosyl hydrolase family 65 [Alkalibacterium olivapovliticus]
MDYRPNKGVWSNHPSSKWEDGYFIGNGETGGIVFGGAESFKVILNHHSLYLKTNKMNDIPDMSAYLEELRDIIKVDGYQAGINYFEMKAMDLGYKGLTMSDLYHPAAEIAFRFDNLSISPQTDFTRALDFEKGLILDSFLTNQGQRISKKAFISKKSDALYLELSSSESFSLNFTVEDFEQSELDQQTVHISENEIQEVFTYIDGSNYVVTVKWMSNGREKINNNTISVSEATSLRLCLSVSRCDSSLEEFDEIEGTHISDHSTVYNQVSLQIADKEESVQSYEELISRLETENTIPLGLYERFYDASRYFIQSMSGPAVPNLQGIWSGDFRPAWSGDFTFDTNVQLAIASQASLGLFDQLQGLFEKVNLYKDDFRENAQKYYGCRGFLVPVHASTRALHVHWNKEWPLIFWTSGAGWLGFFYNEYYDYTLDKVFLKNTAIPFYIETLQFYEDFVQYEEGVALFRPSYSAENGMGDNATMDIAVVKATLAYLKKAYTVLEYTLPKTYKVFENALPEYMIDSEGVLKEWIDESAKENPNHRHFSNLYPVFQTKEITVDQPDLWKASHKAFDKRLEAWLMSSDGDTSSSHGRMHAAMCAVALERPNDVEKAIGELIRNRSFFPSFASSHYNHQNVFNLDANGSFPKIVHDALMYTEKSGVLTLFKAVPYWLQSGTLKGIRLPNQVTVNHFSWDLNKGTFSLSLTSEQPTVIDVVLSNDWVFKDKQDEVIRMPLNETDRCIQEVLISRS